MNIKELNIEEISDKIKKYLPPYIQKDFRFQENYILEFNEISSSIPEKYHKLFKNSDMINSASGCVETDDSEFDYIIILLSNENYSRALFLLLQKVNKETSETDIELLKSFVSERNGNK